MKTKHSTGPDGQQLLLNSGRGRGRPKKNAGRVTTINPESDDYFKTLDKGGGPTDCMAGIRDSISEVFVDFWTEPDMPELKVIEAKPEKGEIKEETKAEEEPKDEVEKKL